ATESGIFAAAELEDLFQGVVDSEPRQRILSLISRHGELVDAEVLATAHIEGDRRVLQLLIRDLSGLRHSDIIPRDAQKLQVVNRAAGPLARPFEDLLAAIARSAKQLEQRVGESAEIAAIRQAGE